MAASTSLLEYFTNSSPLQITREYIFCKNFIKKCHLNWKKTLLDSLKIYNKSELLLLVEHFLRTRSDDNEDFIAHTREQFEALISVRCPAASTQVN